MRMRVELEGVLCRFRGPGETHADVALVDSAILRLCSLRAVDRAIVIDAARHMKTWNEFDPSCANLPQSAEGRVMSS